MNPHCGPLIASVVETVKWTYANIALFKKALFITTISINKVAIVTFFDVVSQTITTTFQSTNTQFNTILIAIITFFNLTV